VDEITSVAEGLPRRVLIAIALAFSISGCAFPIPWKCAGDPCEVVVGYDANDAVLQKHRRIVLGLDLQAGSMARIGVGWSDIRILQPTGHAASSAKPTNSRGIWGGLPAYVGWRTGVSMSHRLGLLVRRKPASERAFVHDTNLGLTVMAGDRLKGLAIGFRSASHVLAPPESHGVYQLRYRSRDLEGSSFRFSPENEKENQ
jgi:hypothetical protein